MEYIMGIPVRGTFPVWDGGCSAEVVVLDGLNIRNRHGAGENVFFIGGTKGSTGKKSRRMLRWG